MEELREKERTPQQFPHFQHFQPRIIRQIQSHSLFFRKLLKFNGLRETPCFFILETAKPYWVLSIVKPSITSSETCNYSVRIDQQNGSVGESYSSQRRSRSFDVMISSLVDIVFISIQALLYFHHSLLVHSLSSLCGSQ